MGFHGSNISWKPEHVDALQRLIGERYSSAQAAVALNKEFGTTYTRNATIGKAMRLGWSFGYPPPMTPEEKQAARDRKNERRRLRRRASGSIARPRISAPPRIETEMRCAAIDPLHVSLPDLTSDGCRWPYGDGPFTFCGHGKTDGSSYCQAHFFLSLRHSQEGPKLARRELEGAW